MQVRCVSSNGRCAVVGTESHRDADVRIETAISVVITDRSRSKAANMQNMVHWALQSHT